MKNPYELFSQSGYNWEKEQAMYWLRHAVGQGEKDQWFNSIRAMGAATKHAANALQSIVNSGSWK